METKHEEQLNLGNPMRSVVGQPFYGKKPSGKKILEELLNGMSDFKGTCWGQVSINGGYELMLNQCPRACGDVWRINIKDEEVVNWLVNEINQRRHGKPFRGNPLAGRGSANRNRLCGSFDPDTTTSSATKCKCGREEWEHPKSK